MLRKLILKFKARKKVQVQLIGVTHHKLNKVDVAITVGIIYPATSVLAI